MIDLPEDFPVNCFICPLDPAEAAAEIKARLPAAALAALLKTLNPSPPPLTGGLHKLRLIREGKGELVLALNDREANTDDLRFLGKRIAQILESWQYTSELNTRKQTDTRSS